MTDQKIRDAIRLLIVAYPRADFPAETQKAYAQMLKDLDPDMVLAAVQDVISKSTFFPAVAEIRTAVNSLNEKVMGRLDAYSAWDVVSTQIRRIGSYGQPELDDLTARAVDAVGGWRTICMSTNTPSDRARFVQAYDTLLARYRDDVVTLPQVKQLVEKLQSDRLLTRGEE